MFKLRLVFLGVASALVLGTGTALANLASETASPTAPATTTADADAHGDAVANAAANCPEGPGGVHGACVSTVASAEGQENRDGAREAAIDQCKKAGATEDKTEKKPVTKAEKKADRLEDRREHKAFVACIKAASK